MRTEHLQYLLEIDKHQSISAAAQNLYLGQTTLSSIVKSVEEELGFTVFQRTHAGVHTTPEGEEALALIWEIDRRMKEIKELNQYASSPSQPVTIITSPTISSGLALPLSAAYLQKNPSGNLSIQTVSGEEVGVKLVKNEGNIGITYFSPQNLENYRTIASKYRVDVDVVYTDQIYLLVSREHPLAARDEVSCEELQNLTFANLPYYSTDDSFLRHFQLFGPGNRYTTFSDIALIKRAVLTQNMVALLSGYAIKYNHSVDNSRLKAIVLNNPPALREMQLCLIHRSDSNLRYQEKLALQCIKAHFQNLASLPFAPQTAGSNLPEGSVQESKPE